MTEAEGPGWLAIGLDDIEAVPWRGTELVWHPVRNRLGTRIVGIGGYTAQRAGQVVVEGHTESAEGRGHEEVYVVLRGRARFTLDDVVLDAPAGTFVVVRDPAVHRAAVAAEPDTAVIALGGPPVFEPSDSEWIERARPHLGRDPERAQEILEELRAAKPASPAAGIAEAFMALARDDRAAARSALRAVLAERPHLRDAIADDADLAALLD